MAFRDPTPEELKHFESTYQPTDILDEDTDIDYGEDLDSAMSALYDTESGGKQLTPSGTPVESPKGAIGTAQIMPATGPEAAKLAGVEWDENRFKTDAEYNKKLGRAYFKNQLNSFGGQYDKAFAAYNAGPNALRRAMAKAEREGGDWQDYVPDETKDYIKKNMQKMGTPTPTATPKKQFRNPTPEELAEFNKQTPPEESTNDFYDFLKSTGQGLTIGGGDEAVAAIQATKDALINKEGFADWLQNWRKHQQENEAEYEKVKERSPTLSTIGEIGGSIAPALLTGGATAGMSTAARLAAMGGLGAATGALSSKGNFDENTGQLAQDAALGSVLGAGTEGLAAAAGPVLKKGAETLGKIAKPATTIAGNIVDEYPLLRQHLRATTEGLEGKTFFGDANRERIANQAKGSAGRLTDAIEKMRTVASDEYKKVLSVAKPIENFTDDQLAKFDVVEKILKRQGRRLGVFDEKTMGTLAKIKSKQPVPAQELKDLQKYLRDNAKTINKGETIGQILGGVNAANESLNTITGYPEVNKLFRSVEEPIESMVSNIPTGEATVGGIDTEGSPLYRAAKNIIDTSERPFMSGQKGFEQILEFKKGIRNLEKTNPEMLKKMGIDNVDDFFKNIKSESDLQAVMKTISGTGALSQTGEIIGQGLRATEGLANISGYGINRIGALSKTLYNAPNNVLKNVSNKLSSNPKTRHLGDALAQALTNPNANNRNAILFSIMQSPDARNELGSIVGVESGTEQ